MDEGAAGAAAAVAAADDDDEIHFSTAEGVVENVVNAPEPSGKFGPMVVLGLDPGLRNFGYCIAVAESPTAEEIVNTSSTVPVKLYVIAAGVQEFLPSGSLYSMESLDANAGFMVRSWTHRGLPNKLFENASVVIEKPYFNPRSPSTNLAHQLGMITQSVVSYLKYVCGSLVWLQQPGATKNYMRERVPGLTGGAHAQNKLDVMAWARSTGFIDACGVSREGRVDNHVADAALQIAYFADTITPAAMPRRLQPKCEWHPRSKLPADTAKKLGLD